MSSIDRSRIDEIVGLLRSRYPEWGGFENAEFVKDEIDYKRASAAKAQALLDREALAELLDAGNHDEIIDRLEKLGNDNNLLWRAVPQSGDLGVLYHPELDRPAFAQAVFDLLHGEAEVESRLDTFFDHLRSRELPCKWTFATYFLFLYYPESEIFIKPTTTRWFCKFVTGEPLATRIPSGESYASVRKLAQSLSEALAEFGPRDMIDIQSVMWVCAGVAKKAAGNQKKDRIEEFKRLFAQFLSEYPGSDEGIEHIAGYAAERETARQNFDEIRAAAERGEDTTDAVLLTLLPYSRSATNEERGAWICLAPAIVADIKVWFENAGWRQPDDWPDVAAAILEFVTTCVEDADRLEAACTTFADSPMSKGLQTGMLTPILSALQPSAFTLINSKSRRAVNLFLGSSFGHDIRDYPSVNESALGLIEDLAPHMRSAGDLPGLSDSDLFDMFAHWLVGIKKYKPGSKKREQRYWKIAPGEQAEHWEACRDGDYIAIGWSEFGDLSGLTVDDFNNRREEVLAQHSEWKHEGLQQVWSFVNDIQPGDRIIANRGTSEVLGIGTVSGDYYFEPGEFYGHRQPVDWDDLTPRRVSEGGWRRTLVKLDKQRFQKIAAAEAFEGHVDGPPFSAEAFELLKALEADPTQALYRSHREAFQTQVEKRFQSLLHEVVAILPKPLTDQMETEKRLFSRIPKNDFGRGGAWPFYWGALYPKGGKRIEDAQLFMMINHERFEFGFYVGQYGSEQRQRFARNCREHASTLVPLLQNVLADDQLLFGPRDELELGDDGQFHADGAPTWREWLSDPLEHSVRAAVALPASSVLSQSAPELAKAITQVFTGLFPLVQLCVSDEPLPAIQAFLDPDEPEDEEDLQPHYSLAECSEETGFEETQLDRWVRAIERKKQAILFGPPGTGKTYIAQRLARHLVGGGDGVIDFVQFHPAYAYEDFVQGMRPKRTDSGLEYPIVQGRLLEFCKRAETRNDTCVLIIDEINRANLARVFGELMYLLEYRDHSIKLASGGNFHIPDNVRIIGTMNTADRSIALVDFALRRRFAFLELAPNYDALQRLSGKNDGLVRHLITVLKDINNRIDDRQYALGTTFFMVDDLREDLEDIWVTEIEPYLDEYFFDRPSDAQDFHWDKVAPKIMP